MKKILCVVLTALCLSSANLSAQKKFDRGIDSNHQTFVPKGQWIVGGNVSYSQHENKNYRFLVIEGWSGDGYNFKVSPFIGYTFKNNMVAGGRFDYNRTLFKIDAADINLGSDMNFNINHLYALRHGYSGTALLRTYINLGNSKRFGLFNEVQFSLGGSQSKYMTGQGAGLNGTFEKSFDLGIGMAPGLVAFVNDFTAVEVSIGVLGFDFKWIDQVHNQVYKGSRNTSSGNFKINLFSLNLGIAFYI